MAVKNRRSPRRIKPDQEEPDLFTVLTKSNHIRMGLYSDTGIGKTRLIGTTEGRVLLVRSPVDHVDSIITAGLGSNITQVVVHDWGEMDDLLDRLRMEGKKWDWVWYDSWSLIQDVMMDAVWAETLARNPKRKEFGLDKPEYGINQLRLGLHMRSIVGADLFNFGWTAHADEMASPDLDEQGDPVEKLMPAIHGGQGKFSVKFCGYSNLVGYYRKTKKGSRVLHTESSSVYYAKNQYEASGEDWAITAPTMPKIIAKIEEGQKTPTRRRRTGSRRRKPSTRKGR